jgi:hypothetical protein
VFLFFFFFFLARPSIVDVLRGAAGFESRIIIMSGDTQAEHKEFRYLVLILTVC